MFENDKWQILQTPFQIATHWGCSRIFSRTFSSSNILILKQFKFFCFENILNDSSFYIQYYRQRRGYPHTSPYIPTHPQTNIPTHPQISTRGASLEYPKYSQYGYFEEFSFKCLQTTALYLTFIWGHSRGCSEIIAQFCISYSAQGL